MPRGPGRCAFLFVCLCFRQNALTLPSGERDREADHLLLWGLGKQCSEAAPPLLSWAACGVVLGGVPALRGTVWPVKPYSQLPATRPGQNWPSESGFPVLSWEELTPCSPIRRPQSCMMFLRRPIKGCKCPAWGDGRSNAQVVRAQG